MRISGLGATSFGMRPPLSSTTFANIGGWGVLNYGHSRGVQAGGGVQYPLNPQGTHNVDCSAYEYGYQQADSYVSPEIPMQNVGHLTSVTVQQNYYRTDSSNSIPFVEGYESHTGALHDERRNVTYAGLRNLQMQGGTEECFKQ